MSDGRDTDVLMASLVRTRTTEYEGGDQAHSGSVFCPMSKNSVSVEHCGHCARYVRLKANEDGPPAVVCHVPRTDTRPLADLQQLMQHTPVRELMTSEVVCVDSELDLNELAQVFERHQLKAAPVVEDRGVPIGIVSMTDLVHGRPRDDDSEKSHHFPPDTVGKLVDDVMTGAVTTLSENASITDAARVFAETGVHRLPVVADDKTVVGIISLMDLVRWLSKHSRQY